MDDHMDELGTIGHHVHANSLAMEHAFEIPVGDVNIDDHQFANEQVAV